MFGEQGKLLQATQINSSEAIFSRVLLVEDNKHTREHLEKSLAEQGIFQATAAESYKAAIKAIQTHKYDFCILDIGLPDGNGIDLIAPALNTNPDMLILVLTVFGQDEPVTNAIQAGAKGYLLKDQALENIHDILLSMTNGSSPIDARVAGALLQMLVSKPSSNINDSFHLSDNEKIVLQYISDGMLYKEIAYEMEISINTVREYIRRIYKKMKVNSRAQAVHHASQHGVTSK